MKKIVTGLLVALTLAFGLSACGADETVSQSNASSSAENSQGQTGESKTGKDETGTNAGTGSGTNAGTDSGAGTASGAGTSAGAGSGANEGTGSEGAAWIPEEFVLNTGVSLDFTAPSVHTGANEQCTFLWNCTEEQLQAWFLEKYGDYEGKIGESVSCIQKQTVAGDRGYTISRDKMNNAWTGQYSVEDVELGVHTGVYNDTIPYQVKFGITDYDQAVVIKDVKEFLGMLGLGEYAETIIHCDDLSIKIPTENDKGYYAVSANYSIYEAKQSYTLNVTVRYADYSYTTDDFFGYTAKNFEYWDQYFSLGDYLKNCEFDTSSLAAFEESEGNFIKENFDASYTNTTLEQSLFYVRYDFGEIQNTDFEYWVRRRDASGDVSGGLVLKFDQDKKKDSFDVTAYGRQLFEAREAGRKIKDGNQLTDAEIKELCEVRYTLMKKLDSSIDWTVEDLISRYGELELDEEKAKARFECEEYEYIILNNLGGLSLYGEFEK